MGTFEEAKEWLVEKLGMWWPDADEGKLREAARHWRNFAEAVGDLTQATNSKAGTLIRTNSGEAISTFEIFWDRYYKAGHGWLGDLEQAARDIAQALDQFADEVDDVKRKIDGELATCAAVIATGLATAYFTGGLSTGPAATAAANMVRFATSMRTVLATATASIRTSIAASVALGAIEGITFDLAVAQPLQIATGNREHLSLADAGKSALWGAGIGAGAGAVSSGIRNIKEAGGIGPILQSFGGPRLATNGGMLPASSSPLLRNADGAAGGSSGSAAWRDEFNALPKGQQKHVRELPTSEELRATFEHLTAGATRLPARGDKIPDVFELADGTVVQWRKSSTSGGESIDIFPVSGKPRKVHLPHDN